MTSKSISDATDSANRVHLKAFDAFSFEEILGHGADIVLQRSFLTQLRKQVKDNKMELFSVPKDDSKLDETVEWAFIRYNIDNRKFYQFMKEDSKKSISEIVCFLLLLLYY